MTLISTAKSFIVSELLAMWTGEKFQKNGDNNININPDDALAAQISGYEYICTQAENIG